MHDCYDYSDVLIQFYIRGDGMIDLYQSLFLVVGIGTLVVLGLFAKINAEEVNSPKAQKIADAISEGAMTFLKEEYKVIALVIAVFGLLINYYVGVLPAMLFATGALFSMVTGYIGMKAATSANVRTTMAAKRSGEHAAFMVAFFGGGVMGFSVATFGLFGLTCIMFYYGDRSNITTLLTSFGFGASLVAFFARIGGGIYTKSADVGADLVGKIEAGIPEDDPRNPAVIADNVGDCVGDTAGMGADIYESYVGAMISAIFLSLALFPGDQGAAMLPIVLSAIGLLGSVVGLLSNLILKAGPAAMLRNATYVAFTAFIGGSYWYLTTHGFAIELFYSVIIGCASGVVIGLITEYYTGGEPVIKLAKSCESGAATNIIYGLSIGMESVTAPVILLGFAVLAAFIYGGGPYGVAIAAVSMLSTVGITMTVDAYGPIADNAGGIAEMAGLGKPVRDITDKLDALGNTTAAMGKGFAIGSALMTALVMFKAYAEGAHLDSIDVLNPWVLVGMFIGGSMPFFISALTMRSVGNTAWQMVVEVRRQFKEIKGLMEGLADPDYKRCIAISTRAALREMILPGLISALLPILVFKTLGAPALGGLLIGATVSGVMLALMMSNGGGAWDNAKKYIEAGHFGGKGSDAHKAAVVGDTVGDPCKDTSGPSLNILIKLMSIVSLLLVSL